MTTSPPTSPSTADPRRWLALAVLGVAYLMVVLDVSIVNVALPSIQSDLGFSPEDLQWVVSGYSLTFGGFLLLGGRAGDVLGRRRLFMVGLALFALFSACCALAQSDTMLIIFRLLQGGASAVLAPSVFSITMVTFQEGAERNKALGILGAIAGAGRRDRGAAGRHPDRVRRVGVGVLDQRPDRHPHAHLRAAVRQGEPRRGHEPQLRRGRAPPRSPRACCCSCTGSRRPTRTAGARRRPSACCSPPRS